MEQGPGPQPQSGSEPPSQHGLQPPQQLIVQRRPGRAGFWIALIFGILLLFSAGMNMILLVVTLASVEKHGEFKSYTDDYYSDFGAKDKIAVISVKGMINDVDEKTLFGTVLGQVSNFKGQLAAVQSDPNVKAVILEVNSPGGYVTPSDEMNHLLKEYQKANPNVPVIVFMRDLAASGGYYISASADKIVAMPTCTTGSIGVIAMIVNVEEGLDKIGVKVHTIKSGKMKAAGSPFSEFTEEDRKYFQKHIDSMFDRFIEVVYEGRKDAAGWTSDTLLREKIADGRVFSAEEAKANGLIDEIGYFEKAVEIAKSEAGISEATITRYRYVPPSIFSLGGANTTNINTGVNVNLDTGVLPEMDSPKFMYLWKP